MEKDSRIIEIQWRKSGLQVVHKEPEPEGPTEADIEVPRWGHWRQRRLGRIWGAVMLTLGFEPTGKCREALKKFRSDVYRDYRDRLDIAKTLAGWDFEIYEDHLREGESAGDKYVDLSEFYDFAKNAGWSGLTAMKEGLKIGEKNTQPFRQNQKNNYLVLMNEVLTLLPGYDATNPRANTDVVNEWLGNKGMRRPVDRRSLDNYMIEMAEAVEKFDGRLKLRSESNIFSG